MSLNCGEYDERMSIGIVDKVQVLRCNHSALAVQDEDVHEELYKRGLDAVDAAVDAREVLLYDMAGDKERDIQRDAHRFIAAVCFLSLQSYCVGVQ